MKSVVRRITPLETERLMGFPDDYLKIDGDATPDGPRYKGCGNSWASNQPRWILTRLLAIGEGIDPFTGEEL